MNNPAPSMGDDRAKRLRESDVIPNFVTVRQAAQALQTATLAQLHRGDLSGALENLEALAAFSRLYASEPLLTCYMIRVAILGLADDVCWDALQAEGWSEAQLARLQHACQGDELLQQMPGVGEAEKVVRLLSIRRFASGSYEDWMNRYEEFYQSFGFKPPACDAAQAVRLWRQWVFHPLWRFAWADQEQVHFLRSVQGELLALRETTQRPSWAELSRQLAGNHQDYSPPAASWRLYTTLPLIDRMSDVLGGSAIPVRGYPYPDLSRAWLTTMRNLTWHEMARTVIALNRYRLRHGQWPDSLEALMPELLVAPPRDLMDGQVLRYRPQPDGRYVLYSVGQDGSDDGGDPTPPSSGDNAQYRSPWDGRDWVWPRLAAQESAAVTQP